MNNKRIWIIVSGFLVILVTVVLISLKFVKMNTNKAEIVGELSFKSRKEKYTINDNLSDANVRSTINTANIFTQQQKIDELIYDGFEFKIGETKDEIIKNLGTPVQINERSVFNSHNIQIQDIIYLLVYEGIVIEVYHRSIDKKEMLWSVSITGSDYKIRHGIAIGDKQEKILKLLGNPAKVATDYIEYLDSDQILKIRLFFKDKLLNKIEWNFDEI